MGKAIIISDVSFASKNLGVVTPTQHSPLVGLTIVAPSSIEEEEYQMVVEYNPQNTDERGVLWSIESGNQYATIDPSTGLLTILDGASSNDVVVKVVSTDRPTISAIKTISVSRGDIRLAWIGTNKGNYVNTGLTHENAPYIESTLYIDDVAELTFFGARQDGSMRRDVCARLASSPVRMELIDCSVSTSYALSAFNAVLGFGKVSLAPSSRSYIVDNVPQGTIATMNGYLVGESGNAMWLYDNNQNNQPSQKKTVIAKIQTYMAKDADNVTKIDLVAVLHNGVPCFYDSVSGGYFEITIFDATGTIQYALMSDPETPITYE